MKKIASFLYVVFILLFKVDAQWNPVPINLATIYLNSVESESVIVKVNDKDFYRLAQNTNTWLPININLNSLSGSINSISSSKSNILYSHGGLNGKIFISEDYGKTFNENDNYENARSFYSILINNSNKRIYLSAGEGTRLQYSDNLGKSWVVDTLGLDFLQFHAAQSFYNIDSFEYQKANTGVYRRSISKQEPWKLWVKKINNTSQLYSIIKHQENFLGATSLGIYKYVPSDSTWVRFDQNNSINFINGGMESLGRYVVFAGIFEGVYISSNEGTSWTHLPLDTSVNRDFRIKKFDNKILAFTTTGVFALDTNSFTWERFGNKLMGLNVVDMVKVNGQLRVTSNVFGVTESNMQGDYQNTLPKHNAKAIYNNANKIYVATNLGVKQKDVNGNLWQGVHPVIDNQNFLQILIENDTLYCLSKTDFWAKPLKDTSCIRFGSGINLTTSIALIAYDGNLFAITNGLFSYVIYKFNRSTLKWDFINNNLPSVGFNSVCVYRGNMIIATSKGLHQYNELQNTIIEILNTEKFGNIKTIQAEKNTLVFYSETMPGIYFGNDTSYNFYPISGQLPSMNVTKLYFNQDTLYIGGSKGIWFRPLSQLSNSIQASNLNQNNIKVYPNPFSESINIDFENDFLPESDIQLMDIYGRIILKDKIQTSSHTMSLTQLPPGIYFIVIHRGENSKTMKIVKQ